MSEIVMLVVGAGVVIGSLAQLTKRIKRCSCLRNCIECNQDTDRAAASPTNIGEQAMATLQTAFELANADANRVRANADTPKAIRGAPALSGASRRNTV
jgi:hypothetical protein